MAIPESQLETWANRSQTDTAIKAHTRIRTALADVDTDPFLQGSYANHTNTWGDHDVDVVVCNDRTFTYNLDALPEPTKTHCKNTISPAIVTLEQFRREVIQALEDAFGEANVIPGNKSVNIPGKSGEYLDADVVICHRYRRYYPVGSGWSYDEGIAFYGMDDPSRLIVNYPAQHLLNGQEKNQDVDGAFKPIVRIFKNIRARLVADGTIDKSLAPSYFIQGLLYNVPDDQFTGHLTLDMLNTLVWLGNNSDSFQQFISQNGLQLLFGETPEQWKPDRATKFLHQVMNLWANWSS